MPTKRGRHSTNCPPHQNPFDPLQQEAETLPPTPSSPSPSVATAVDNNPPPSPPPQPTLVPSHQHHFDQQLDPKARKRHQAAVRALSPPSDNQGFQYIYLNTRNRLPIGQVRKNFRAIKIDTNRLLDLHYPVNSVLAILIHNDYTDTFMTQITKIGLTTMTSFNPCDPAHLHNPKYKALTTNQRQVQQKQTVRTRMLRILDHLRLPVRNAVAKYYLTAGWILNMDISKTPRPTIQSSAPQQRQQQLPSPQHRPSPTFPTETSAERAERHSSPAYQALPPSAKAFADSCFSLSTI
ncbi:hypothetical protein [Absidia glauca]|uniref:Uncharacterized protein n=1 Tax=Absidia glauca TaxID=4829 RepID=A0A168SRP2_ABSGL|nr:hypothetical protein [Absidia glauca]